MIIFTVNSTHKAAISIFTSRNPRSNTLERFPHSSFYLGIDIYPTISVRPAPHSTEYFCITRATQVSQNTYFRCLKYYFLQVEFIHLWEVNGHTSLQIFNFIKLQIEHINIYEVNRKLRSVPVYFTVHSVKYTGTHRNFSSVTMNYPTAVFSVYASNSPPIKA